MKKNAVTPTIYTRDNHPISRQDISQAALNVLYDLHKAGYRALLVGGCIRDLLRGEKPKDFDVVTDATPEQIKKVFNRNCRLIGRRFRLAHVYYGCEIIEVATFRADEKGEINTDGQVINHNTFGTLETDVFRRDFTLNALYYDIADFSIIDYVGAMQDINNCVIRMIGNPEERYEEDPVRMLRAARFAAKLGMRLDPTTEQAIATKKHLLANIPSSRLFDETNKLFMSGHALESYNELRMLDLFGELFPETSKILNKFDKIKSTNYRKLLNRALKNTDYRIKHNERVSPAFLFAVILWPVYQKALKKQSAKSSNIFEAMHQAIDKTFITASQRVGITMRHKAMVREIWILQTRLTSKMNTRRIKSVLQHKRFRAGFDFLELRLQAGEEQLQSTYDMWVQAQIDMPELIALHTKTDAHNTHTGKPHSKGGEKRKRRRRKTHNA